MKEEPFGTNHFSSLSSNIITETIKIECEYRMRFSYCGDYLPRDRGTQTGTCISEALHGESALSLWLSLPGIRNLQSRQTNPQLLMWVMTRTNRQQGAPRTPQSHMSTPGRVVQTATSSLTCVLIETTFRRFIAKGAKLHLEGRFHLRGSPMISP